MPGGVVVGGLEGAVVNADNGGNVERGIPGAWRWMVENHGLLWIEIEATRGCRGEKRTEIAVEGVLVKP
jgi:hypothetical protein